MSATVVGDLAQYADDSGKVQIFVEIGGAGAGDPRFTCTAHDRPARIIKLLRDIARDAEYAARRAERRDG